MMAIFNFFQFEHDYFEGILSVCILFLLKVVVI